MKDKGITLVALVITIIILVLLAGISISAITNQGLFGQTLTAKNLTEQKTAEENETLQNYLEQINAISEGKITKRQMQIDVSASTETSHIATAMAYTWEELSEIAKKISNNTTITNDTLAVKVTLDGVEKIIGVGDTATVDGKTVRILGFNHDELTTKTAYGEETATGKAGISFEYVDILLSRIKMNSNASNSGGWEACELRTTLNSTTYDSLSIKDKIKQVNKEYLPTYNITTKSITSDYLWLLSCGEIWNNGYNGGITRGNAVATEGSQYKYYKIENPTYDQNPTNYTKKPSADNPTTCWLRSPYCLNSNRFALVSIEGSCGHDEANYNFSALPGFCI